MEFFIRMKNSGPLQNGVGRRSVRAASLTIFPEQLRIKVTMKEKRKLKIAWAGTGFVVICIVLALMITPTLFAQSSHSVDRYLSMFDQVFRFVHENYVDEPDPKTLFEGALTGLFDSLDDPHSTYLTENDMQDLTDTTSGKFGGVGLYISKSLRADRNTGELPADYSPYVRVVAPIEDTPAAKAGLHAGDLITEIEGESTEDMNIDQVVDRLRGVPGSEVQVRILRNSDINFTVNLMRAIIEVPTAKHAMINGGIGYLRIIQFTPLTPEKVLEAITYFKNRNYNAMIIDVRSNPGGLLSSVVDVADLILSGGVIVSTRSRIPSENAVFNASPATSVNSSIPIAVLIDQGSASASEILSGALKDRDRAILIGEKTFGKGSVQQLKYIGEGGFKLTMSRYYTPSGNNIDKIGIEPDIKLSEPELNEAEQESFAQLLEEQTIAQYVSENAPLTEREINSFVRNLQREGNALSDRLLKKLVRNEINRSLDSPPVYDLEYDLVLQEAVRVLQEETGHRMGSQK